METESSTKLLKSILQDAKLTVEEFNRLRSQ
jgi:hypothetical protein